jgi:hypothetical protein
MAKDDADAVRKKREKLEAELAVLRDQERTAAEKCYAIAGRAVLDHAAKNPGFKQELMRALDAQLTKGRERKLFGLVASSRIESSDPAGTEGATAGDILPRRAV